MLIVPRAEWGAKLWDASPHSVALAERHYFVVHYDGGSRITATGPSVPRRIDAEHHANGWSGIGYNFVVDQAGTVFEGRGWGLVGAHCPGRNRDGIGVQVAIGGDQDPTPAALTSVRALYSESCRRAGRQLIAGRHGDYYATECCGPRLTPWVRAGMPAPSTTREDDMPLSDVDLDRMFKGGKSTDPTDVRARYQVRDGKDLLGITEAMGRQLALLRQIAAGQFDYDRLAAAIVAHGGTAADSEAIAQAVRAEFARELAD